MAFSNSFPHLGHAIGHTLGAKHHIPHGTACGLAIPGVIEFIADIMPDRVRNIGQALELEIPANLNPEELGAAVADAVRKLNSKYSQKSHSRRCFATVAKGISKLRASNGVSHNLNWGTFSFGKLSKKAKGSAPTSSFL